MILEDPTKPRIDSQLIVTLAKQALNNLPQHSARYRAYDSYEFQKEFCTVNIGLPRQSGHSTAALQLMFEYPDSLCFVPDGNSRECMRSLLRQYTDNIEVRTRIERNLLIPDRNSIVNIRPVQSRTFIIIDQASCMQHKFINQILGSLNASIVLKLE